MSDYGLDDLSDTLPSFMPTSADADPDIMAGIAGTEGTMGTNTSVADEVGHMQDAGVNAKPDDTWFTKDRLDAMKKASQFQDFSTPQLSIPQSPQIQAGGQMQRPQMPQMQQMSMQMPQMSGMSPLQHPAPMQLQAKHGALGAPLQRFRRGGAVHMELPHAGALKPAMGLKTFANGGMMHAAMPAMMASLHSIRQKLSSVQPQVKGAVPIGRQMGPGTGRSDSIHAKFADGGAVATGRDEYVLPADVVAYWGQGSSDAGADAMDAFVHHTRELNRKELGALPPPRKDR